MRISSTRFLIFVGLALFNGCSTPPKAIDSKESIEGASEAETTKFQEVQRLFLAGKFEALLQKMQSFSKSYPKSPYAPHIENYYGLTYLALRRPALAIIHFERAAQFASDQRDLLKYINYNLAKAHFDSAITETKPAESNHHLASAEKYLNLISLSDIDRDNQIKCHYLRANLLLRQGKNLDSARETLRASKLLTDLEAAELRERRSAFYDVLDAALKGIKDLASLEVLFQEYIAAPISDGVLYRLGILELEKGANSQGRERLQSLTTRFPESPYFARAKETLALPISPDGQATPLGSENLQAGGSSASLTLSKNQTENSSSLGEQWQNQVDVKKVGVLIPLSGKLAGYGRRVLGGIQLSAEVFESASPTSGKGSWEVFVEDAGESPESAIQALDRLVLGQKVAAVIGPIIPRGIDQITKHADQLGVPLLNLSKVPVKADHVLSLGPIQDLQIRELVNFAVKKKGWKRFAIVYPNDRAGEANAQLFWDAVDEAGGEIRGIESYNPAETDFRKVIDHLTGLSYLDARGREVDQLAQERKTQQIKKRTRKTEKYFSLPPIADFDAVFIADEPKPVSQIIPTFAYRDVDHVYFLGTASWNSPDLAARTSTGLDRTVFVDVYSNESTLPQTQQFLKKFKATFSMDPTFLEAIGYDSFEVFKQATLPLVSTTSTTSRGSILSALRSERQLDGASGELRIRKDLVDRQHQFFTFDKSGKLISIAQ
jgi:ABC-type branched-subunit amino acid transport system substrate-binding protein